MRSGEVERGLQTGASRNTRDGKPVWIRPRRGVREGATAAWGELYAGRPTRHSRTMMATPAAPAARRRSPVDRVVTVVMCVVAAVAAGCSVVFSFFFVMATDSCGSDNCDLSKITWAYALTWGGVGVALAISVTGLIMAARRGTAMWVWPVMALVLVIATFAGGAALAMSVVN